MYRLDFEAIFGRVVENLQFSYAPYSRFFVSACAVMKNHKGEVKEFYGVNVENSSYGLTVCAERVAIFKGVSEGYKELVAVVLSASCNGELVEVYPCGACRQVMLEFGNRKTPIYNGRKVINLGDLMPFGFSMKESSF